VKRLFTFGCSFTHWIWPTWADIYATQFDFFENWGYPSAGNLYIFNSIIEANKRHKFTADDTIVIMWSGILRSDYYNFRWEFNEEHKSIRASEIINYGYINSIDEWFSSNQLNYTFLSIHPYNKDSDVYELYKDSIDKIKSMVYVPHKRNIDLSVNDIATYQGYHQYVADWYNMVKGSSWPNFDEYVQQFPKLNIDREMKIITKEIKDLQRVYTNDMHPTPNDYLDNLKHWFNFSPTIEVQNWVQQQTELITQPNYVTYVSSVPKVKLL
jgi:hypothetical protein